MKHRALIVSAIIAFFAFFLPLTAKVHASWILNDQFDKTIIESEKNNTLQKESFDTNTLNNMFHALRLGIVGCVTTECTTTSAFHYSKSAVAGINNYIVAMIVNPPARTYYAVEDFGQTLGFIPKQAYAQGSGFNSLKPLLGLWKAFRNIAYLMMAVILIVIGFMVMFRKKIDPKTVVTVQNALPRIVITLILITFSYAIVGLMIDLMYLIMLLTIAVIGSAGLKGINTAQLQQQYLNANLTTLFSGVFGVLDLKSILMGAGGLAGGFIAGNAILPGFGGPFGSLVGTLIGGEASGAGAFSPILNLIFALALLFGFVRIFFMLISAYIQVILAVIVGPLQIMFEAIPGANGFTSWMRNLVINLMTFPITVIMLILGAVINDNLGSGSLWVPPLLPGWASSGVIKTIIGVALVLTIPNVIAGVKKSLKAQPALPIGLGTVISPVTGATGTVLQTGYQFSMASHALEGVSRFIPGFRKGK